MGKTCEFYELDDLVHFCHAFGSWWVPECLGDIEKCQRPRLRDEMIKEKELCPLYKAKGQTLPCKSHCWETP